MNNYIWINPKSFKLNRVSLSGKNTWRSDSIRKIPKAITASLRRSSNWNIPWKSTGHIQRSFCTWKTAKRKNSGTRSKVSKHSKGTTVHVLKLPFKNPPVDFRKAMQIALSFSFMEQSSPSRPCPRARQETGLGSANCKYFHSRETSWQAVLFKTHSDLLCLKWTVVFPSPGRETDGYITFF